MNEGTKKILRQAGFGMQVNLTEMGRCPMCGEFVTPEEFRNEVSMKEFLISGMCQDCQDDTFGKD